MIRVKAVPGINESKWWLGHCYWKNVEYFIKGDVAAVTVILTSKDLYGDIISYSKVTFIGISKLHFLVIYKVPFHGVTGDAKKEAFM